MKSLLVIAAVALSSASSVAFAAQDLSAIRKSVYEKLPSCGQAIESNDAWLAASLPSSFDGRGNIHVTSLTDTAKTFDFVTDDTVVDLKIKGNKLYALTETTLETFDLVTGKNLSIAATHPQVGKGSHYSFKAMGFIFRGESTALIAHGRLGFSLMNLETGVVEKTFPMPTVSAAQDITLLEGKKALVAVDNADEATFRGIYIMDLSTLSIVKQIKIDNAMPLSIRTVGGNRLYMGYLNAVWKFDLNALLAGKDAQPNRRAWKFPGLQDVDMRGKVFFDENNLYSCFEVLQGFNGSWAQRKSTPLVFKLSDVKLN